jgi:glyoxylase-like metal-dependent hydrolase (beta-lactamase superfamily II)
MSATRRAWSSGSACRSTRRCPTRRNISCGRTASPPSRPATGSPDLIWLLRENKGDARPYTAGERLPIGVEAFPGQKPNDTVLWIESHRAVIAGDTLADFGEGPQINPRWLSADVTREQVVEGLRPLLALPVEHFLGTHGGPYDRSALERALA